MLILSTVSKPTIWGSDRLYAYGGDRNIKNLGQLYTVAANDNLSCIVLNGEFKGKTLYDVFSSNREMFGYDKYDEFPLLIGFVDAAQNLSIQIHPNDEYAKTTEHKPFGKNESWLFIQPPESGSIINGCKCGSIDEVKSNIKDNKWDDIIDKLPVNQNEYVYVQSGTLHALTAGSLVYEIQQSTDITYRFYDYDRTDDNGNKRPLQLEKALDVIDVEKRSESVKSELDKKYDHQYYTVEIVNIKDNFKNDNSCFSVVTLIDGEISYNGIAVKKGSSFVMLPHESVEFSGSACVVVATPK